MHRLLTLICLLSSIAAARADYRPRDYVWTSQSRNSSQSMPCGGHDIGINVWVENGDLLFYIQQSGWFDENNTLLKAGRWRLRFDGQPFSGDDFRQRLSLYEGAVYVEGGGVAVRLWADVFQPVVFVETEAAQPTAATLSYESWRYRDRPLSKAESQQSSYKWIMPPRCHTFADSVRASGHRLAFCHHNRRLTVFDFTVSREHLDAVKSTLYNPIGLLKMGGEMQAPDFAFTGTSRGLYAATDFRSWNFRSGKIKRSVVAIRRGWGGGNDKNDA